MQSEGHSRDKASHLTGKAVTGEKAVGRRKNIPGARRYFQALIQADIRGKRCYNDLKHAYSVKGSEDDLSFGDPSSTHSQFTLPLYASAPETVFFEHQLLTEGSVTCDKMNYVQKG